MGFRVTCGSVAVGAILLFARSARGEPSPPPTRSTRGAVVALRTGYSIPMGKFANSPETEMSDAFSGQVLILAELGWRPIPALVIGGYLGVGVGGAAGLAKDVCNALDASCVALGAHFGVELQYHMLPEQALDPWLGYGLGLEFASLARKTSQHRQTQTLSGLEYAHFMAGADFRIGKRFGLGPIVDLALGRYSRLSGEIDGSSTEWKIANQASHQWLTLGVRGVFYP